MKPPLVLAHKFVKIVPEELDEHTIYVSTDYTTVVHLCCCGCGREVVTPLSPTDWTLIYDGVSVSLSPSIGNWSFECQSHYWIDRSRALWAPRWSRNWIEAGRARDQRSKEQYYGGGKVVPSRQFDCPLRKSIRKVRQWLSGLWRP